MSVDHRCTLAGFVLKKQVVLLALVMAFLLPMVKI
jgi:hypothetical protein